MSLITETNAQYYSGQQVFQTIGGAGPHEFVCTFNTQLIDAPQLIQTQIVKLTDGNNYSVSTTPLPMSNASNTQNGAGMQITIDQIQQSSPGSGIGTPTAWTIVQEGSGYEVGDIVKLPQIVPGQSGIATFEVTQVPVASPFLTSNYVIKDTNGNVIAPSAYSSSNNVITIDANIPAGTLLVQLSQEAINNNYGNYEYTSLEDVINNFMVGYVGYEKIIPRVNKTDVVFHAKRGLQEFSYDLLKVLKSQELSIPVGLSVPIPQDYVNYVRMSWVDDNGGKHIIYPTRVTSSPTELPVQDGEGIPTQDNFEENIRASQSLTEERWASQQLTTNYQNDWDDDIMPGLLGQRYGLQPEEAQVNGKFVINNRLGTISFTSDLVGKVIILEYISDGLAYDADMKIPKLAEEAIYMHIIHAVLSTRRGIPEYIINRYKRERSAAYRNAKIRLSNIKIEEIAQVFRNKAKWIKH